MSHPDLKHCPFCGCEDVELSADTGEVRVQCQACFALLTEEPFNGNVQVEVDYLMELWNTRHAEPVKAVARTVKEVPDGPRV